MQTQFSNCDPSSYTATHATYHALIHIRTSLDVLLSKNNRKSPAWWAEVIEYLNWSWNRETYLAMEVCASRFSLCFAQMHADSLTVFILWCRTIFNTCVHAVIQRTLARSTVYLNAVMVQRTMTSSTLYGVRWRVRRCVTYVDEFNVVHND